MYNTTAVTRKGPLRSKFHKLTFFSIPISQLFLNTNIQRYPRSGVFKAFYGNFSKTCYHDFDVAGRKRHDVTNVNYYFIIYLFIINYFLIILFYIIISYQLLLSVFKQGHTIIIQKTTQTQKKN